jgi:hypothetical protein
LDSVTRERRRRTQASQDLANAMLAHLRGVEPRGAASIYSGCNLEDFEQLAHIHHPGLARVGLSTTSDWAQILTNVFEKRLLDFYRDAEPTYRPLTRRIPLRDFRQAALLRVGEFPQLQQIGNGVEIKTGYVADGGEPITLLSLGRIFSLSDEAFTNNDVMGFNEVAELAANTTAIAENALFYGMLLSASGAGPTMAADGLPFFHASHGNLMTGSTLDAPNLGLAMAALRKQTAPGEGAQKLNLPPRYLLCGPDQEVAARTAVAAITPGGAAPSLDVLVDAHLSVSAGWYVFTSPDLRPAFVAGFLSGEYGPNVKARTGWTSEGPEWRVTRHVGVAPFDFRCAVRNPGQ